MKMADLIVFMVAPYFITHYEEKASTGLKA